MDFYNPTNIDIVLNPFPISGKHRRNPRTPPSRNTRNLQSLRRHMWPVRVTWKDDSEIANFMLSVRTQTVIVWIAVRSKNTLTIFACEKNPFIKRARKSEVNCARKKARREQVKLSNIGEPKKLSMKKATSLGALPIISSFRRCLLSEINFLKNLCSTNSKHTY